MDKAIAFNRRQCLCALISAAVVVVCVCIGVTLNLTMIYADYDNVGIRSFCLFTVNSNILAAAGMMQVFPYALDGLRKNNYHLPNWVVVFLYTGTAAVTLTLIISLALLTPIKGISLMFSGPNFFLHGVCPVITVCAFIFFISDHRVTLKESFWALVPVLVYGVVYFVMVLVIGEDKGGWEDFYGLATVVPSYVSVIAIPPAAYGIATLLRLRHNGLYRSRKKREAALYKAEFANADVRALIAAAGRSNAVTRKVRDIVVPVRVIEIMVLDSDCSVDEGCRIFLEAYLDALRAPAR